LTPFTRVPFTLVTGNRNKLLEAERILGELPDAHELDLPEIQALDINEVLRVKGAEAFARLGRPIVVEETGLELDAMNGFPGALVKWMLDAIGPEGIARTALALGNPGVTARCALLYQDSERVLVADGATTGVLVGKPRGSEGFGWDPVFVPEGRTETYAELPGDVKDEIGHRGRAWRNFVAVLREAGVLR
jgi:non-canonical purine NTP pyrophosphatase (RdgB/HAM1 family)